MSKVVAVTSNDRFKLVHLSEPFRFSFDTDLVASLPDGTSRNHNADTVELPAGKIAIPFLSLLKRIVTPYARLSERKL
jgi:hypothetical protein